MIRLKSGQSPEENKLLACEQVSQKGKAMRECWYCGKTVEDGKLEERPICPECEDKKAKQATEDFNLYWRLKNKMTLERAVKRIEEDAGEPFIDDLREAIETVAEYVEENPQKLDSTEEYIMLIMLLHHRTRVKCQHKILNYKVDFFLPDLKVVLEIDGYFHKGKKLKDTKRDLLILHELGKGYEVVRIPTEYVNKYPKKLFDAILDIKAENQKYREKHKAEISYETMNLLQDMRREQEKKEIDRKYSYIERYWTQSNIH